MSKGVNKHCSILNYIRHADNELYELVQDLCIGRIFVPRRGSPGITFLRPDKSLLKEIQKMASGENPEDAVEAIQSLVLLDNISSLREFEDKKSDIPTFLRKKLPVVSADSKKASLKNGAEIVPDSDFMARGDRPNISVYVISKQLVPTDTDAADFSNAKAKEKRGGGYLGEVADSDRKKAFEAVLEETFNSSREPAMELLVAMHSWAQKNGNEPIAELIRSQASYDALASLAVVLQPYKEGNRHISDDDWMKFKGVVYGMKDDKETDYKSSSLYSFNPNAQEIYEGWVKAQHPLAAELTNHVKSLSEKVGRPSIVTALGKFYNSAPKDRLGLRGNLSPKELFAEAELRAISALLCDNEATKDEVKAWFKKLDLSKPYMCDDKAAMAAGNIGVYFSTVYLIARSNALLYVPGMNLLHGLDSIANESVMIDLNRTLEVNRKSRREKSASEIQSYCSRVQNAF